MRRRVCTHGRGRRREGDGDAADHAGAGYAVTHRRARWRAEADHVRRRTVIADLSGDHAYLCARHPAHRDIRSRGGVTGAEKTGSGRCACSPRFEHAVLAAQQLHALGGSCQLQCGEGSVARTSLEHGGVFSRRELTCDREAGDPRTTGRLPGNRPAAYATGQTRAHPEWVDVVIQLRLGRRFERKSKCCPIMNVELPVHRCQLAGHRLRTRRSARVRSHGSSCPRQRAAQPEVR